MTVIRATIILALASIALAVQDLPPASAHGEWAWIGGQGVRNPVTKEWCCSEKDCMKIGSETIAGNGKKYRVKIGTREFEFPVSQTMLSQDTYNWACLTGPSSSPYSQIRCLFITGAS